MGVWRHILSPLHILSSATTYAETRGTYQIVVQQRIVAGVRLLPCIYCHLRQYKPKIAAYIVVPSCRERETLYLSLDSWECSVYMVVFNGLLKNLNNHIYNVKFIHLLMYVLPTRRSRKAIFKQSFEDK